MISSFGIGSRFLLGIFLVAVGTQPAWAQYPTHRVDAFSPCGGQVGTSFDVQILGTELEDLVEIQFSHPGISAVQKMTDASEFVPSRPINDRFQISIAADVPPGIYEARVKGRFGISNPRRFVVDTLPEAMEVGGNQNKDNANPLAYNSVVNGRVDANVEDFYRVSLSKGESVVIECQTRSIDSRATIALKLYDATGREFLSHRDPRGTDCVVTYEADEDQELIIGIRDFLFKGGPSHFYRLAVHGRPFIAYVWPPSVKADAKTEMEVFGWNLPEGKPHPEAELLGQPLQSMTTTIDLTQENKPNGTSFVDPSAFANEFVELQLTTGDAVSNRYPVFVSSLSVIEELDASGASEVQEITLPIEVVGHFAPVSDVDQFQFSATKGEVLWIDVRSQQLGSATDPEILIQRVTTDEQGQIQLRDIAAVDDPANRNGSIGSNFDITTDDPSYRLQVPEDGNYRVVIKNLFSGRIDQRDIYRLRIQPETPTFRAVARPVLARPANGNQVVVSSLVLRRGEARNIPIAVHRHDGHNGVIRFEARNLPQGVICEPLFLTDATTDGFLRLIAGDEAASSQQNIEIVAVSELNGETVEQVVPIGTVVWGTNNRTQQRPAFRITNELPLSVLDFESAPILLADAVAADDGQKRDTPIGRVYETSRGGTLNLKLNVTRRNEFAPAFNVVQVGLPREFGLNQIQVPENANELAFTLNATNNNLKPGWYRFHMQGDVKWSYQKNPEVIARVQAEVQRLTELVPTQTMAAEQAKTDLNAMQQATNQADEAVKAAEAAKQKAVKEVEAAKAALAERQAEIAKSKEALQGKPDDQSLQQAVSDSEQRAAEAVAEVTNAEGRMQQADESLVTAKGKAAELATELMSAQKRVEESAAKLKTVQDLKTAADQQLKNVTNAYKPADLTETMVSPQFYVHLVASPIGVEVADAERVAGETFDLPVQITRDYGFADAIQIDAQLPGNFNNANPMKLTINADQNGGNLQIVTNENTNPGTYPVTVKATAKFNNVNVETTTTINLVVKPKS